MHLDLVSLIVNELRFELVGDSPSIADDVQAKRWIVVRPPNTARGLLFSCRRLTATPNALSGGRSTGASGFFLRVSDFDVE